MVTTTRGNGSMTAKMGSDSSATNKSTNSTRATGLTESSKAKVATHGKTATSTKVSFPTISRVVLALLQNVMELS